MKSNTELGFTAIARVGDYCVGKKGNIYRAYGYEWKGDQSIVNEGIHHEVCGRGSSAIEAIDKMIEMATIAGRTDESAAGAKDWWVMCPGLGRDRAERLRRELHEAVAEAVEGV